MGHSTLAILTATLILSHAKRDDNARLFVDIVEPTGLADVRSTMATVDRFLRETGGVDFVFKVAGEPRVLAILNIPMCDVRALEMKLLVAKLDVTMKSLLLGEKLAAVLGVSRKLIRSAPRPTNLTGDYVYLWDAVFRMEGLGSKQYKKALRDNLEESLKYRLDNHRNLIYRVIGGFPIQMMYFVPMKPEDAELVVWHFNRDRLVYTVNVVLLQSLDVYLNGCRSVMETKNFRIMADRVVVMSASTNFITSCVLCLLLLHPIHIQSLYGASASFKFKRWRVSCGFYCCS